MSPSPTEPRLLTNHPLTNTTLTLAVSMWAHSDKPNRQTNTVGHASKQPCTPIPLREHGSEGGTHTLWCFSRGESGDYTLLQWWDTSGTWWIIFGWKDTLRGGLSDFGSFLWLSQRLVMFKNTNKLKRRFCRKKNNKKSKETQTARLTKKDHKGSFEWWWYEGFLDPSVRTITTMVITTKDILLLLWRWLCFYTRTLSCLRPSVTLTSGFLEMYCKTNIF